MIEENELACKFEGKTIEGFDINADEGLTFFEFLQYETVSRYMLWKDTSGMDKYLYIGVSPDESLLDFHFRVFKYLFPILKISKEDKGQIEAGLNSGYSEEEYVWGCFGYLFGTTNHGVDNYYVINLRNTWDKSTPGPLCQKFHDNDGKLPMLEDATLAQLREVMKQQPIFFSIVYCK